MPTQVFHRGSRFRDIRLVGLLGSGGFSDVYLGEIKSGTKVAVKVLRAEVDDLLAVQRFKREAEILQRVSSRAVTRYIDSDFECETPWIATEFIDGPTLRQFKDEVGKLTVSQAVEVMRPIVEAMVEGHALGIIHRDINPDNILVTNQGSFLIDFGVSSLAQSAAITIDGSRFGTPGFTAPERESISLDTPAIDVFSISAVFRWMITDSFSENEKDSYAESIPDLVNQGLDPDPESRISMENFAEGLLNFEYAELQKQTKTHLPQISARKIVRLKRRFELKTVASFVIVAAILASIGTYGIVNQAVVKDKPLSISDLFAKFKPSPKINHQNFSPKNTFYLSQLDVPTGVELFADLQAGGTAIPDSYPIMEKISKKVAGDSLFEIVLSPISESIRLSAISELDKPETEENSIFEKIINNRKQALLKTRPELDRCDSSISFPEQIDLKELRAIAIGSYISCEEFSDHIALLTVFVPAVSAIIDVYLEESTSEPKFDFKTVVESISFKRSLIIDISEEEQIGKKLNIQPDDLSAMERVYPPRMAMLLEPQDSVLIKLNAGMSSFIQWFGVTSVDRSIRKTVPLGSTIADRENKRSYLITNPFDFPVHLIGVIENQGGNVFDEVTLSRSRKKADAIVVEMNSFIYKKLQEVPNSDNRTSFELLGISESDGDFLDYGNLPNDYIDGNVNQLSDKNGIVGGIFTNIPTNWASTGDWDIARLHPSAPLYSPTRADFPQIIVIRPKVFYALGPGVPLEFLKPPSDLKSCSPMDTHDFKWEKGDLAANWIVYTECQTKLFGLDFAGQPMTAPHIRISFSKNGIEYLRVIASVANMSSLIYFGIFLEDIVFTNSVLEDVGKSTGSADEPK
jgi:serine/threonine protein kinase